MLFAALLLSLLQVLKEVKKNIVVFYYFLALKHSGCLNNKQSNSNNNFKMLKMSDSEAKDWLSSFLFV